MNAVTRIAEHALKDKKGKPVLDHFNQPGRFMADPNNGAYRQWYLAELKAWFSLGVYAIQRDEPTGLGGLGGLRRWQYPDADRFFREIHAEADKIAGRPVAHSCNLAWNRSQFGGEGEPVTRHFHFGVTEMVERIVTPKDLWTAARDATKRGKKIVYTGAKPNNHRGWAKLAVSRRLVAALYGLGQNAIVPWDMFGGVHQPRIFAKPEQLADLFGFIRAVAPLLEGYEEAAACIPGHAQADGDGVVRLPGGGAVSAFVRATSR